MTTLGYTTTPSFGQWGEGWNVGRQVGCAATTPAGGSILISTIHCYAASFNGTNTMTLVVWDGSGNVLASVAATAGVSSSPAWVQGTLGTSLLVAGSTTIYIGWANPNNTSGNSGFTAWYDQAGGTSEWNNPGSVPSNLLTGGTQYTNRSLGAYVDYTPAGMYVRRSGVWTSAPVYVRRSGTWVQATVYVRRSGAWVPGG